MEGMQHQLDYVHAVAGWYLDLASNFLRCSDYESTLQCLHVAATVLSSQNRALSSPRLESTLLDVAARVFHSEPVPVKPSGKRRCLHVLTEALPAGGLTAMARRWIEIDNDSRRHEVALLSQEIPVPEDLSRIVRESGGKIHIADPRSSMLSRAQWLRRLALSTCDYVILHVDVADVIAPCAFGAAGGPPVILVNHTAHIFWTGTATSDVVANCRGSELEHRWTQKFRGVERSVTVPIPLIDCTTSLNDVEKTKQEAKAAIGIPPDATVMLTVGASFKYLPMADIDFLAIQQDILRRLPEARLIVVGFQADSRWKAASKQTGNRISVLGTLNGEQLGRVRDAADVYVEGFPFGTTTALLEAGLRGIPVALAPACSPPPYGSDGVALDSILERPGNIERYKEDLIDLCTNPSRRAELGLQLRNEIAAHHTGGRWRSYVDRVLDELPDEHRVYELTDTVWTEKGAHEYWSRFVPTFGARHEESLERSIRRALKIGLKPQLTEKICRECGNYGSLRRRHSIPLLLLDPLLRYALRPMSPWLAFTCFRAVSFVYRKSFMQRLATKLRIMVGLAKNNGAYGEYRNIAQSSPELHFGRQSRDPAAKICSAEEVSVDMKENVVRLTSEGMQ